MDSYRDPNQQQQTLFQVNLDAQNSYYLRSSASWARILGAVGMIVGSIIVGLFVYTLVVVSGTDYRSERFLDSLNGGEKEDVTLGALLFIIAGAIFFAGGLLSYLFGRRISDSLRMNNQEGMNNAFRQLRSYFALRSITVIVVLIFLLLFIIGSASGGR